MRYSFIVLLGLIFSSNDISAQEITVENLSQNSIISYNDLLDKEQLSIISYYDSIKNIASTKAEITPEDLGVIRRMKSVSKTIQLDYNGAVKEYVEKYVSSNWRPYMNRLLGLSRHYFKIYDKVFEDLNLPNEIKYLSLVESSLNPHLVSTSGAVGPWQFMYVTAKEYSLDMNSHIDERKDAYASCYAVSKYLEDSYVKFNDWLLAIASYNCGKGCVQRAIARSGLESPTFWELSPYLPKETQNYVPKYIAMTYVLSNADHYGIQAVETELDHDVKEMMVDKNIDLKNVANALGISLSNLKAYNPAFKRDVIAATSEKPRRLLVPQTASLNDSLLYLSLNTTTRQSSIATVQEEERPTLSSSGKYRVKSAESLSSIAAKFDVTVQDLRSWNNLTRNSRLLGRDLIVQKPTNAKFSQHLKTASTKQKDSNITYYTVKKGDSLERIASKYDGVSVSKLKADNNIKNTLIKPGMRLKIKRG